jgi:hypothetical protein
LYSKRNSPAIPPWPKLQPRNYLEIPFLSRRRRKESLISHQATRPVTVGHVFRSAGPCNIGSWSTILSARSSTAELTCTLGPLSPSSLPHLPPNLTRPTASVSINTGVHPGDSLRLRICGRFNGFSRSAALTAAGACALCLLPTPNKSLISLGRSGSRFRHKPAHDQLRRSDMFIVTALPMVSLSSVGAR